MLESIYSVSVAYVIILTSVALFVCALLFHIVLYYAFRLSKIRYKYIDYFWLSASFIALILGLLSENISRIEARIANERSSAQALFERANGLFKDGYFDECGSLNDYSVAGKYEEVSKLSNLCFYLEKFQKQLALIDFQPTEFDPLLRLRVFEDALPQSKQLSIAVGVGIERVINARKFRIESVKQSYNRQAGIVNSLIERLKPLLRWKTLAKSWKFILLLAVGLRLAKATGEIKHERCHPQVWKACFIGKIFRRIKQP